MAKRPADARLDGEQPPFRMLRGQGAFEAGATSATTATTGATSTVAGTSDASTSRGDATVEEPFPDAWSVCAWDPGTSGDVTNYQGLDAETLCEEAEMLAELQDKLDMEPGGFTCCAYCDLCFGGLNAGHCDAQLNKFWARLLEEERLIQVCNIEFNLQWDVGGIASFVRSRMPGGGRTLVGYFGLTTSPEWRMFRCVQSKTNMMPHYPRFKSMFVVFAAPCGKIAAKIEEQLISKFESEPGLHLENKSSGGEHATKGLTTFVYFLEADVDQYVSFLNNETRARNASRICFGC